MTRDAHVSGLDRLVFFSDGIYAIAATLLAIDIRIPTSQEPLRLEQVASLAPSVAATALANILLWWYATHRHRHIDDRDAPLLHRLNRDRHIRDAP